MRSAAFRPPEMNMESETKAERTERPLECAVVPAASEQAAYDNLRLTCTTHHEMCRRDTLICPFGSAPPQVKCWTCGRGWPFGHNEELRGRT